MQSTVTLRRWWQPMQNFIRIFTSGRAGGADVRAIAPWQVSHGILATTT